MKINNKFGGNNNDNPNEPPKAGAMVSNEGEGGGNNDNPNEPPKAGASLRLD